MKVCYLITTCGHGRGGHFYSLRTTAEALSRKLECVILNVGICGSPVIDSSSVRSHNVRCNGFNVLRVLRESSRILAREGADVIHAFDARGVFVGKALSAIHRKPLVLTKCGGPNPKRYYPRADSLIVYSTENEAYFRKNRRFSATPVYHIPNRATRVKGDPVRTRELRSRLDPARKVLLRIARFTKEYLSSALQCINLVDRLEADGVRCQLVLIGAARSKDVLDRVAARPSGHVRIFCSDEHTVDASELLDVADLVVGTGRGFMEAASMDKVLLTPLADAKYPLLVTAENIDRVRATNLSPRNRIPGLQEEENYRAIVRVLRDGRAMARAKRQAERWFQKYFNIESVIETYCDLYRGATYRPKAFGFDYLLDMYSFLRSFTATYVHRFPARR